MYCQSKKGYTMKKLSSPQRQGGYLMEVPLLFMAVMVVLAILFPRLSPLGQKILISLAAIPIIFVLYYMIIIPGWQPGDNARLRPPWNWLVFLLSVTLLVTVVLLFVLA